MSLAAHALDFGFRDHRVGRALDCALQGGEVVCLLGPNGSGKSTLMRTLLGLQAPLAGAVTLEGRDLRAWRDDERARTLAYVPQAADSHFDFSLREIVEMGRSAHRGVFASPGARDREIAAAMLERLGIGALADRPVRAVSGGERQLALIARALATEARFVLMDEPTANLDYGNQSRVLEEVARLRGAGIGVLVSTHHPEHAFRVADRVLLLADGTLVAEGPTQATLTSAALSALYGRAIEVASVTLADGTSHCVCVPVDG